MFKRRVRLTSVASVSISVIVPLSLWQNRARFFAEHLAAASACIPKEVCHKLLDYMPEAMLTAKRKTVLINYKRLKNSGSDCVWHVFEAFF